MSLPTSMQAVKINSSTLDRPRKTSATLARRTWGIAGNLIQTLSRGQRHSMPVAQEVSLHPFELLQVLNTLQDNRVEAPHTDALVKSAKATVEGSPEQNMVSRVGDPICPHLPCLQSLELRHMLTIQDFPRTPEDAADLMSFAHSRKEEVNH